MHRFTSPSLWRGARFVGWRVQRLIVGFGPRRGTWGRPGPNRSTLLNRQTQREGGGLSGVLALSRTHHGGEQDGGDQGSDARL